MFRHDVVCIGWILRACPSSASVLTGRKKSIHAGQTAGEGHHPPKNLCEVASSTCQKTQPRSKWLHQRRRAVPAVWMLLLGGMPSRSPQLSRPLL